jgi:nucleoside-diphosphate-sugar epimerase
MVNRSAPTRRIASWTVACFGNRAHSWAKRLYHRHAAPVVHTLDRALYGTKCHIVIDKVARELGYAPTYDLKRGMAQTAAWIKDNFRDEIAAIRSRPQ